MSKDKEIAKDKPPSSDYSPPNYLETDVANFLKIIRKNNVQFINFIKNILLILIFVLKIFFYPFSLLARIIYPIEKELIISFFALLILMLFIPTFTYWVYAQGLTEKEKLMNSNDTGVILLDRNGKPFFTFYEVKHKTFIPLSEIPDNFQKAVIAMEDREFYYHSGFSVRGIIRSIKEDLQQGELVSGGSTITQQLVKNSLLNPQKNLLRKYQEITLAYKLEKDYSKEDILEMYLNSVYFGEGAFGVEEASKTYFAKSAKALTLGEASLLAAVLPAPSKLSPLSGDFIQVKNRQEIVLNSMVKQQYISEEEKNIALSEEITLQKKETQVNKIAPHFALMVRDELITKFGEENIARSGFRVKTSIDLDYQTFAENAVKEQVQNLKTSNVSNGAAVAINPNTGQVLALVGSVDWFNEDFGKVNILTSLRQPGSSFKPIVYVGAFEKGILTPATILDDKPITYPHGSGVGSPSYSPQNYDRKFRGKVLARRALANSLNVPSVEVLNMLGVPSAVEMAKKLGINTLEEPDKYGLSLTLGSGEVKLLELTHAYSVFANSGVKNDITLTLEVYDKHNNLIYKHTPTPREVIKPEYAFLVSSILSDEKARAEQFGNVLNINRTAAVKTGTSENYRDSVTVGYTPSVAVGVWVGNNNGEPMNTIAGSLGAAPIWKKLMEKFLEGKEAEKFEIPSGVVALTVCKHNGLLLKNATSSGMIEYFVKGTEPHKNCTNNIPQFSPSPSVVEGELINSVAALVNGQTINFNSSGNISLQISGQGNQSIDITY